MSLDLQDSLSYGGMCWARVPLLPGRQYSVDAAAGIIQGRGCMRLALRRFASAGMSGKMTSCLAASGGKASISPKSSEAWPASVLMFLAEIFSAIILATASGSPTAELPHSCVKQACISCNISPILAETSSSACLSACHGLTQLAEQTPGTLE